MNTGIEFAEKLSKAYSETCSSRSLKNYLKEWMKIQEKHFKKEWRIWKRI